MILGNLLVTLLVIEDLMKFLDETLSRWLLKSVQATRIRLSDEFVLFKGAKQSSLR